VAGLGSQIRGLFDSGPAPETVDFPLYPISAFSLEPSSFLSNRSFVLPPSVRLSLQKNNSTFSSLRRLPPILHSQICILHFCAAYQKFAETPGIPPIPANHTCPSHQTVDCVFVHRSLRLSWHTLAEHVHACHSAALGLSTPCGENQNQSVTQNERVLL
jgi:hypothetical protein